MKLFKLLSLLFVCAFAGNSMAADITLYYSPSCPHCHHARDFIRNELIYVYDNIKVNEINVMEVSNRQAFFDTIKKCEYESGGVPVMVIGEKCFQGYGESMNNDIRNAIEADFNEEQKKSASENKAEFDKDKSAFTSAHADRLNAITGEDAKKKLNKSSFDYTNIVLLVVMILLVLGVGVLLFKKQK